MFGRQRLRPLGLRCVSGVAPPFPSRPEKQSNAICSNEGFVPMLNTTVRRELHEPRSDVMRTRGKAMDCIGLGFAVVIALIANGSFARAHKTVSVTSYPDFVQLCTAFVVGHAAPSHGDSQSLPVLGRFSGDCSQHKKPLLFSFSHENAKNSHIGAANYKPEIHSYMSDFDLDKDRGRWLDFKVSGEGAERQIALAINSIHYQDTDLTGWPLRYGHLFVGANDLSAVAILEQNVRVEFDIRVPIALLRSQLTKDYSGVRVLIGAVAQWTERPPRINRDHFFEIDLMQTNGYNESYGDPSYPACDDGPYDRCYYSPAGRFAEGRNISLSSRLHIDNLSVGQEGWTHISVPLSSTIRGLHWVSPPATWGEAKLKGIYIGIESQGAVQTMIEIRHYNVVVAAND